MQKQMTETFSNLKITDFQKVRPRNLVQRVPEESYRNPLQNIDLNEALGESDILDKLSENDNEEDSDDYEGKPMKLFNYQ